MRIEFLPGMDNVIRFPVERRRTPSVELLYEIMPDIREVEWAAESFFLELPGFDLCDQADREMAEYILNQVRPEPGDRRRADLDALLEPLLAHAVATCQRAGEAAEKSSIAVQNLVRAQSERSGSSVTLLEEAANEASLTTAKLWIEAYEEAQEVLGAARAVGIAKCGEIWRPRDHREEERALFGL
jgi:hypothetical protein